MRHRGIGEFLILLLAAGALLAGCGGGEEPGQTPPAIPPGSASVLAWDAPGSYADNTTLDPYQDLDYYEVYLREDARFSDGDVPVAQVAAVADLAPSDGSPPRKELVTAFVLENLGPFVAKGKHYYVSIKAVGSDGQKSGFMAPLAWDHS